MSPWRLSSDLQIGISPRSTLSAYYHLYSVESHSRFWSALKIFLRCCARRGRESLRSGEGYEALTNVVQVISLAGSGARKRT